jgi:hypothetical protein
MGAASVITDSLLAVATYVLIVALCALAARRLGRVDGWLALPVACISLTLGLYLARLAFPGLPLAALLVAVGLALAAPLAIRSAFPARPAPVAWPVIVLMVATALLVVAPKAQVAYASLWGDAFAVIRFVDEEKHVAFLASFVSGPDLAFPFDPTTHFAYYYFFYLAPAAVLAVFPHAVANPVWVAHLLSTQLAFFCAAAFLLATLTASRRLQIVGMLVFLFGTSLKSVVKLAQWYGNNIELIEVWWTGPNLPGPPGWQISHPMVVGLWVPQHQFAGLGCLLAGLLLMQGLTSWRRVAALAATVAVTLGASAFVGITLIGVILLWTALHLRDPRTVLRVGLALAAAAVTSIPFLVQWASVKGGGLFVRPELPAAPHWPAWLGVPIFYLIETGTLLLILAALGVLWWRRAERAESATLAWMAIAVVLPLAAARVIQSEHFNDFGMRSQVVLTAFSPLLLVFLLDRVRLTRPATAVVAAYLGISVATGLGGGLLEASYWFHKIGPLELETAAFRAVLRETTPRDIVVVNDQTAADLLPGSANRLTLEPIIPFAMQVYVPRPSTGPTSFREDVCRLYERMRRTPSERGVVYLELRAHSPLACEMLAVDRQYAEQIAAGDTYVLYRLPADW